MPRRKRQAGKAPTTMMKVDGDMRVITPQSGVPQAMEPLQLSNWVATGEGSSCMQQETTMPVMLQKEESTNSAVRRLNFPKEQAVPSPIKVNSKAEGPTMADVVKNNRAQHLVEEDHSAPTKVQVQRSGKQVVVFQGQTQGNQHEVQSHQEEDLDSDSEETLGINQYSALRCYEEAVEKRVSQRLAKKQPPGSFVPGILEGLIKPTFCLEKS
ncbi:hypothetical protein A4A49_14062 [Nicotiana attenuata]|uniref:Uncharacterized protein n=1 Tax=Nicotiana attenuata TaxID=49451 RepID=A0A314KPA0_NICAT|nr:hypothetical protein A4A49_14062 [Nicotiana attenuata]